MYNGIEIEDVSKNNITSEADSETLKSDYFQELSANELFYCLNNKSNGNFDNCLWKNMKIKDFDEIFGMMQTYSQLFNGGTVLDVGCGDGQLVLLFSLKFKPNKIIGIDISKNCLMKASELKNRVLEPEFCSKTSEEIEITRFMAKCPSNLIQTNKVKYFDPVFRNSFIRDFRKFTESRLTKNEALKLKKSILFKMSNIFNYTESYKFSAIICLSITKWIGLNFGIEGMRKLFGKLKSLLEYKGVLVIDEPSVASVKKTIKNHKNHKFNMLETGLQNIVKVLTDEYQFVVIKEKTLINKRNKKVYILLSL